MSSEPNQAYTGVQAHGNAHVQNGNIHGGYVETNHYNLAPLNPGEQTKKNAALLSAARDGDNDRIRRLIQEGADPHHKSKYGLTALHQACRSGHQNTAEMLITSYRIDVNTSNRLDVTPLYHASYHGHGNIIALLLRHGARLDGSGPSPLTAACREGSLDNVKRLVTAGIPVSISRESYLEFFASPSEYHPKKAQSVLGTDGLRLKYARPLHAAANAARPEVLQYLLQTGAAVDSTCELIWKDSKEDLPWPKTPVAYIESGFTPLHLANHPRCVTALLDHGADINRQTSHGATAVMRAALGGVPDVLQTLVDRGAHINIKDNSEASAMDYAKKCQHPSRWKCIEILEKANEHCAK